MPDEEEDNVETLEQGSRNMPATAHGHTQTVQGRSLRDPGDEVVLASRPSGFGIQGRAVGGFGHVRAAKRLGQGMPGSTQAASVVSWTAVRSRRWRRLRDAGGRARRGPGHKTPLPRAYSPKRTISRPELNHKRGAGSTHLLPPVSEQCDARTVQRRCKRTV